MVILCRLIMLRGGQTLKNGCISKYREWRVSAYKGWIRRLSNNSLITPQRMLFSLNAPIVYKIGTF